MKVVYEILSKLFLYYLLLSIITELSTTLYIFISHSKILLDTIDKVKNESFIKLRNLNLQISYSLIENINRLTEKWYL